MAKKLPATTKTGQPHKPRPGRPSHYTKKMADDICADIRGGASLRTALLPATRPDDMMFYRWMGKEEYLRLQYAQATRIRADVQFEELNAIHEKAMSAVEAHEDNPKYAGVLVSVYKLQADNMKWAMSKMMPKKYGAALDIDPPPVNMVTFINEVPNNQPVPNVNKDS